MDVTVVANVTSDSNKGSYMKTILVLLFSFFLMGCGESLPDAPGTSKSNEAAVAAIEKLGGDVTFDAKSGEVVNVDLDNAWMLTDAGLLHLKEMTSLRALLLVNTRITDVGLEHLKGMASLRGLGVKNTQITDAGLEHLKDLTSLTTLDLARTQITDAGLVHVKGIAKLQRLALDETQITDAGLEHLKGMTSLRDLRLSGTQITGAGLAEIKAALPKCKISK